MANFITGDECDAILLALARGHGERGFTEGDAETCSTALALWKVSGTMFGLVMAGELDLVVREDGEVACTKRIR